MNDRERAVNPLFSIITVTYNAEKELPVTLASVDAQSFGIYEHLIIDGASHDHTLEIARNHTNCRRKVFSSPDKGLYDAMNKGLARATGEYVVFLNAGDAFHSPKTLQCVADTIMDNDFPGVVYGQTDLVGTGLPDVIFGRPRGWTTTRSATAWWCVIRHFSPCAGSQPRLIFASVSRPTTTGVSACCSIRA